MLVFKPGDGNGWGTKTVCQSLQPLLFWTQFYLLEWGLKDCNLDPQERTKQSLVQMHAYWWSQAVWNLGLWGTIRISSKKCDLKCFSLHPSRIQWAGCYGLWKLAASKCWITDLVKWLSRGETCWAADLAAIAKAITISICPPWLHWRKFQGPPQGFLLLKCHS